MRVTREKLNRCWDKLERSRAEGNPEWAVLRYENRIRKMEKEFTERNEAALDRPLKEKV